MHALAAPIHQRNEAAEMQRAFGCHKANNALQAHCSQTRRKAKGALYAHGSQKAKNAHHAHTAVKSVERQRTSLMNMQSAYSKGKKCPSWTQPSTNGRQTGEQSHLPSMMSLSSQQTCPASKFLFDWDAVIPRWRGQAPGLQKQPVLRSMPCKPASFSTSLHTRSSRLSNSCSQSSTSCRASIEAVWCAV